VRRLKGRVLHRDYHSESFIRLSVFVVAKAGMKDIEQGEIPTAYCIVTMLRREIAGENREWQNQADHCCVAMRAAVIGVGRHELPFGGVRAVRPVHDDLVHRTSAIALLIGGR
jgi:hypothetical protein